MAEKICIICGKPAKTKNSLCEEHEKQSKKQKLKFCQNCGYLYFANEDCKCKYNYPFKEFPTEGFSKCIICGKKTNGYAFCKDCYATHGNNEMLDLLNNIKDNKSTSDNKNSKKDLQHNNNYSELPAEGFNNCVLCGKETNGYAFCKNCYCKYNENELLEILNNDSNLHNINSNITINKENKSKCITCGRETDGLLFCGSCYHKYKDKELLVKITNCSNVELIDENYEGRYTCKDGHIVKSKSERDIDNYLFENNISHAYEKELPYGASEKEVLHPDFFLQDYLGKGKHVYIEHWGYNENNIQYTKTKNFKMPIYKDLGITLICTYEKNDMGKIDTVLERKLNKKFIKENQINYEE